MKYLIFPKGYNPMMASGPPDSDTLLMGISWTEEDTQKAKELKKQAIVSDSPVEGQWYTEVDDEFALR